MEELKGSSGLISSRRGSGWRAAQTVVLSKSGKCSGFFIQGGNWMIVGVPKETFPGERRVALSASAIPNLVKAGMEVLVEAGAGASAGYPDSEYARKARRSSQRARCFQRGGRDPASLVLWLERPTGKEDLPLLRKGQVADRIPASAGCVRSRPRHCRARALHHFPVELIPRTTRAQSMDALSSMAHDLRLQGGDSGGRHAAANFPDADDRRGDDHAGKGLRHRRGRCRIAGDRHGAAAGRGGLRL